MKKISGYVKDYFIGVDKRILLLSIVFTAAFVFINYHFHLNKNILRFNEAWQYASWFFIFLIAFLFPYFLLNLFHRKHIFRNKKFLILLMIAPAIFSWKMVFNFDFYFTGNQIQNLYWNSVVYYPLKLVAILLLLFLIWKLIGEKQAFYGLKTKNFNFTPYFIMLLIMVPFIAAASSQHDFLLMYPKFQHIAFLENSQSNYFYKLLYELSYGTDFFSIEIFFRGFLILAFAKWFGRDCILPMACFYFTIHFGKPLAECISSFFGGIILGIVIYNTRTIFGGLIVHLGIAWMMELGGYLGNFFLFR